VGREALKVWEINASNGDENVGVVGPTDGSVGRSGYIIGFILFNHHFSFLFFFFLFVVVALFLLWWSILFYGLNFSFFF
jgi:hypothetical protein